MSMIASTVFLTPSQLLGLREASNPKRRLFGRRRDDFETVLARDGIPHPDFAGEGHVLATVLTYLDEAGIDLMKSEHGGDAALIGEHRECSCFILTPATRDAHAASLAAIPGGAAAMQRYYEEFHGEPDPEAGEAMEAAVAYLRSVFAAMTSERIALLMIG